MLANPDEFYHNHPSESLAVIEGTAAVAWLDSTDFTSLHLARVQERPLTLAWTRRGDMVMSSTPESLRWLSRHSNIRLRKTWEVPEGTYLRVQHGEIVEKVEFEYVKPKYKSHSNYSSQSTWAKGSYTSKPTTATTTPKADDKPPLELVKGSDQVIDWDDPVIDLSEGITISTPDGLVEYGESLTEAQMFTELIWELPRTNVESVWEQVMAEPDIDKRREIVRKAYERMETERAWEDYYRARYNSLDRSEYGVH
jgi:hypothetical protein